MENLDIKFCVATLTYAGFEKFKIFKEKDVDATSLHYTWFKIYLLNIDINSIIIWTLISSLLTSLCI